MEPYELKRGAFKNLTLRLRTSDGTLKVSAPWFLPKAHIDRFVAERQDWIAEKRRTLVMPDAHESFSPSEVLVWGVPHRVVVQSPGRLPRVVHDAQQCLVTLRVPSSWGADRQRKVLEDWEKARVVEALTELVPSWSSKMGLRVDRWTVKRLRSRWGSCRPSTRSLVFNARLGALPRECLEHVVVHELVHLIELSHNARFHALVEHWLPGSRRVRAMLRMGGGQAAVDAFPDARATPAEEMESR